MPNGDSELSGHVAALRRRKWIVVVAVVVTTVGAVFFASGQAKSFEAGSRVFVNPSAQLTTGATGTAAEAQARYLSTEAALAHTREVAAAAVRAIPGATPSPGVLLQHTTVAADPESNILTISVTDGSAQTAVMLANAYARAFQRESAAAGVANIDKGITGVNRQISAIKRRIVSAKRSGVSPSALRSQLAGLIKVQQKLIQLKLVQPKSASVVQPASGAEQVRPNVVLDTALGVIVGLVIGLCIAFLAEAFDTRVRSSQEVGQQLGLPVLARIPAPARARRGGRGLAMLSEEGGPDAEAYRKLRLAVDFANVGHAARTILVTSAVEQEGKSTTVANLALAYASTGRRVALVDLDLRRPAIGRFFGLDGSSPGATDVALGSAALTDAIVEFHVGSVGSTDVSGGSTLFVLPAGSMPPHPAEFLESEPVRAMIAEVADTVDVVLVDSPPMLPVSDAQVLGRFLDGVIVVVQSSLARRPALGELRRLLGQMDASTLGFALTAAEGEDGEVVGYGYEGRAPTGPAGTLALWPVAADSANSLPDHPPLGERAVG
jgi:capsular exopolysaccharide synthesis family protein